MDIQKEIEQTVKILNSKQPIRLKPIMIQDKNLQSKMPLIDIPIQIDSDQSMNIDNDGDDQQIEKQLENHIRKLIPEQKPRNFIEFDQFWRELSRSDMKQQYLSIISIDNYRKIFEYPFESSLLFDVLDQLSQLSNQSLVYEILDKAIVQMPRFDLCFSFLSENEYRILKELFTNLIKNLNCDQKPDVIKLAKKFNLIL